MTPITKAPEAAPQVNVGADEGTVPVEAVEEDVLLDDLLVEEVSIDGMCGVY